MEDNFSDINKSWITIIALIWAYSNNPKKDNILGDDEDV